MWRTFNMGIGMVVVVPAAAQAGAAAAGLPVIRLGEIAGAKDGHRVILR
jgi:phosphoribosylaminoimidazole (AIR) synthetase